MDIKHTSAAAAIRLGYVQIVLAHRKYTDQTIWYPKHATK